MRRAVEDVMVLWLVEAKPQHGELLLCTDSQIVPDVNFPRRGGPAADSLDDALTQAKTGVECRRPGAR